MAWHFSISLKEKCQYRIKWYTHFLKQKKCTLVQPDRRIYCMRSKFSASGLGTFTVMQSVIVIGHHFVPPTETFRWNSMKNCMSAILITFYVVCVCSFCVNGWQVLVVKVCPGIWVNHVKIYVCRRRPWDKTYEDSKEHRWPATEPRRDHVQSTGDTDQPQVGVQSSLLWTLNGWP